ncbi:MAG: helix-turn-helix domain-containing protein [Spirochaetota bacterium]
MSHQVLSLQERLATKPAFTTSEAAAIAGVHPETIRRMIREDRLPALRFGGGNYRIRAEVLAAMLGIEVGGQS